ncbi:MAG: Cof-type HAD-IIB family hydrolase [Algisphaera sp.]
MKPPAKIRMIAIDVDGTLLSSDKRLSVKAIEAVTEARRKGIKVVIATARPPRTVLEIYNHLKLNTHQVNYNGALIQHPEFSKPLHHEPLTADLAYAICSVARKTDENCVIALEVLDKWYTDRDDPTLVTETSKTFKPDYIGPLLEHLRQPVTKLLIMAPPDRMAIIRETLVERYRKSANLITTEGHLTQISARRADKAYGLRTLCEKYKVDRSEVLAMGDGQNDLRMLHFAGLGVAMGNATDDVKAVADVVGPTNDEEGVARTIRKYCL